MRAKDLKRQLYRLLDRHGHGARVRFLRTYEDKVEYHVSADTSPRILDEARLLPTWSLQMQAASLRWLEDGELADAFGALAVLEKYVGEECYALYLRDVAYKLKADALRNAGRHLPEGALRPFVNFVRDIS